MIDNYGTPYSEGLHVVERIRLVDAATANAAAARSEALNGRVEVIAGGASIDPEARKGLRIEFTVEDPKYFTTPWSARGDVPARARRGRRARVRGERVRLQQRDRRPRPPRRQARLLEQSLSHRRRQHKRKLDKNSTAIDGGELNRAPCVLAATLEWRAFSLSPRYSDPYMTASDVMRIGIIGAGQIGGTLTRRLRALGHEVHVANSRDPKTLAGLAAETGAIPGWAADMPDGADLVIVTIPMKNIPDLPRGLFAKASDDLVVVDTCNYYPRERDGLIAPIEAGLPESRWVEQQLSHAVIKAFNNIYARHLLERGRPAAAKDRIALPVAGDDKKAKAVVLRLVDQLGFDAVDAGGLDELVRANSLAHRSIRPISTPKAYAGRFPRPVTQRPAAWTAPSNRSTSQRGATAP